MSNPDCKCGSYLCQCRTTYVATPMSTIKPPLGLRPKYIAYSERLKEIHAAMGRYLEAGQVIPVEWVEEFDKLNREMM